MPQLSYGHSDGRVQDKIQFIDGVVTRKATVKSLTFPELTIAVAGNAAVVRHLYESEKRNRRQDQYGEDRDAAGLAEAGRRLETPGSARIQAGLIG